MRLTLRFLTPLIFALTVLAYASMLLAERLTLAWFERDLNVRARFAAVTLEPSLVPLMNSNLHEGISVVLERAMLDERLYAMALCDLRGRILYQTQHFPRQVRCNLIPVAKERGKVIQLPSGPVQVSIVDLRDNERIVGTLVVVHDMSFAVKRSGETKRYVFLFFLLVAGVVSLITVLIVRWSWKGWIQSVRTMIQERGDVEQSSLLSMPDMLPLLKDLREMVSEVELDRKFQEAGTVVWTPGTLKELLRKRLAGENILIVANREPYIHIRQNGDIAVQIPASGVVTALEPVMKACSGTWIAHGSGSADREVVDANDRILVPPGEDLYQLRRVWLTEEEENGYYYGFANEGIWPLCHIAHTRPVFRTRDWEHYNIANQRFADAVVEEAQNETPVILVQDYHFAMLPALIRKRLPNAVVITFWHIPWPNPEAFGICPWRNEIIEGMLGSTILGFHTKLHAHNFLETVDRFVECRIDRARSTIFFRGEETSIKSYPISIAWPPRSAEDGPSVEECRQAVLERYGLTGKAVIGVGVDRLDYTKGILERLYAVERLFELYPEWRGKFSMIQIGAPSRSKLDAYQLFRGQVLKEIDRINSLYQVTDNPPVIFVERHHSPSEVLEHLRAANVCLVTSLHDGMNLLAKEFVGARDDLRGVLVLSMFAGASRELPEALIINPYNIDQCAHVINFALRMPETEQQRRMESMRDQIRQFNVYRWAGRMLVDAAQVRKKDELSREISEFRIEDGGLVV